MQTTVVQTRVVPDPAALRSLLAQCIGERHHATSPGRLAQTREIIRQTLMGAGWTVREQPVRGPFGDGANLIGHRAGDAPERPVWILGAHYDTVRGTPGADDNGVAIAGVLEAARLLSGWSFRDAVELAFWDMEETQSLVAGSMLGSGVMAAAAHRERRALAGTIAMEMLGYRSATPGSQHLPAGFGLVFPDVTRWIRERGDRGDFIAAIGNPSAHPLLDALRLAAAEHSLPLATLEVSGIARLVPHFYRSDHAPFWRAGYPAVMLTDTAEFRNPHYHGPTDTMDTLDFDFASRAVATALTALVTLAQGRPLAR